MKLLKHEKEYWAKLHTHAAFECREENCAVHSPSNHHMRTWPINYRMDRGITERICKHGIGHPDPDCIRAKEDSIHGCDGCCQH